MSGSLYDQVRINSNPCFSTDNFNTTHSPKKHSINFNSAENGAKSKSYIASEIGNNTNIQSLISYSSNSHNTTSGIKKVTKKTKHTFIKPRNPCLHCNKHSSLQRRTGPYGKNTLCNACGLYYRKCVEKVGLKEANKVMRFRRIKNPLDRRVVENDEVPQSFTDELDKDIYLNSLYMTKDNKEFINFKVKTETIDQRFIMS